MTREEAIKNLQFVRNALTNSMKIAKTYDMAIKALEQEPCDDVISRQAVIDTVESWLSCDDYNEAERHIMRAVQSVLYDLPPVTPKPKTGHWIVNPKGIYAHLICDRCLSNAPYDCRTNFCPICGACMKDGRTLDEFIEDSKEREGA